MVLNEQEIKTVLMTTDTVGGVWTYCMDLVRALSAKHIHFHVVTAGAPLNEAQRKETAALDNITLYETEFKLEWMNNPWHDIDFSGWQLVELARKIQPDLIHLNSYSYASLPFRSPVIVVAHSDVFSWWFSVRKSMPGAEWQQYFMRVKDGIRKADCVVAPSHSMLNSLCAIYGSPADTRVIHNGRNHGHFSAGVKAKTILCAGRLWDEAKNLELLAKAAPDINAPIRVAGDIHPNQHLPYAENIAFLGKIDGDQMAEELSASLLYVSPAKYEPFGLSILEAALSGCALVLGDIASLREIWKDSAVFVNPGDAGGLSNACNKLLESDALAAEYSRKAMQRAQLFSLEKMGTRYYHLYEELVRSTPSYKKMQIA